MDPDGNRNEQKGNKRKDGQVALSTRGYAKFCSAPSSNYKPSDIRSLVSQGLWYS